MKQVAERFVENGELYERTKAHWWPMDSDVTALARAYLELRRVFVGEQMQAGYAEHEAEEIVDNLERP